jgi:hypothetical protein
MIAHLRTPVSSSTKGELIDTGGNFNMSNNLDHLVNMVQIKPFSIGMAAKEDKSTSMCTHRGDFPIPMLDGSVFYTPMYYNAQASNSILSPEAICYASDGLLSRWSQSGSPNDSTSKVSFYNNSGAEVISLTLNKRNGLYYSPVSAIATDKGIPASISTTQPDVSIYYHTYEGVEDDGVSLDFDDGLSVHYVPLHFVAPLLPVQQCHPCLFQLPNQLHQCSTQNTNRLRLIYGRQGLGIAVIGNSRLFLFQRQVHQQSFTHILLPTMTSITKQEFVKDLLLEVNTLLAQLQQFNDGIWILGLYVPLSSITHAQMSQKIEW